MRKAFGPDAARARLRRIAIAVLLAAGAAGAVWGAAYWTGATAAESLRAGACGPLQIVDRFGRELRTLPAACGHRGRGQWVALSDVPALLREAVIASEDRRFERHLGIDPLAVARALLQNARAGKRVSGASTLTMQLARMLHDADAPRTLGHKLKEAWLAFALERRASKAEIVEAYLNHAYYGAGAYGVADAARVYFGKTPRALSRGEAALLAVLPRAPSAYDPRRHLSAAVQRRSQVLRMLVGAGVIDARESSAIEAEPLAVREAAPGTQLAAGHFVDWVLGEVPPDELRAGGVLTTTLDLDLQRALERAAREHVARMCDQGVQQAGLVVIDSASGEVRAMVGSVDYAAAQVNIVTRRRQLGSLLKPFVYALAIEGGASPASIALDVGDVDSEYRDRDWVGREAGPLSYREALAGSYNLAAVHVLEGVGVPALHARLRRAGVGELSLPPARYGLALALGAARTRLLDVASGYGFLVREGLVRAPSGIVRLDQRGATWRPRDAGETRVFSPSVSFRTLDVLSDAAARHRRFGLGLPLDGLGAVAAKTGTASGMSDVSTILASRELIVAAWAGRFDGAPVHGSSGMWGAAPLARRAFEIAMHGRSATLPPRPDDVAADDWRDERGAQTPPAELAAWAARARAAPHSAPTPR
jgi:penicillin-binding protein 1C